MAGLISEFSEIASLPGSGAGSLRAHGGALGDLEESQRLLEEKIASLKRKMGGQ